MKLTDGWMMTYADPGAGERLGLAGAEPASSGGSGGPPAGLAPWTAVAVPGDVHTGLLAAGQIEDPFFDRNVEDVQWVEDREWWYQVSFTGPAGPAPAERDVLVFDGLDTLATVYLNGQALGSHRNMFRPAEFDVSGLIAAGGRNVLAVRFDPVRASVPGQDADGHWGGYFAGERRYLRKNQAQFSWDWAPRLVNVGIWREVRLERFDGARLLPPYARTLRADGALAVLSVESAVQQWDGQAGRSDDQAELSVTVRLSRHGRVLTERAELADGTARAVLSVPQPDLWWPHGLGDPALYELEVTLQRAGRVIDRVQERIGLRTVELDRTPDPAEAGAERFGFVVNGIPVFAKGANWIPADALNGRVGEQRYSQLLRLLTDANGNMVRVWGGGQYEQDAFYDLADELGIMVWQDFMFACATYPDDAGFAAEVAAEAQYQVQRLRNRPSLVIWVGNNEIDWIDDTQGWAQPGRDYPGKHLFHGELPELVRRLDPGRPYWPSSPYGGDDHNSAQAGDRHNWQVWHGLGDRRFGERPERDFSPSGVSYHHYADDSARFVSEFGMHAAPVLETLARNVSPADLALGSDALLFRNCDVPKNKGDMLMAAHTGLPADLAQYIDYSMICQAEGLKFAIEHYRRRKPRCSGTLFWQWDDCWPGLSWSVLDYYAFPKAGYFYVKRAYAPVLASLREEPGGTVSVWLTNDTLAPVTESLTWTRAAFDGQVLAGGRIDAHVSANSSALVGTIGADELADLDRRREYLWLHGEHGHVAHNRLFFAEVRDLVRDRPEVAAVWDTTGDDPVVTLKADQHAYFVRLFAPDAATRYSDNWFDLVPGQEHAIRLWRAGASAAPPDPASVHIDWR